MEIVIDWFSYCHRKVRGRDFWDSCQLTLKGEKDRPRAWFTPSQPSFLAINSNFWGRSERLITIYCQCVHRRNTCSCSLWNQKMLWINLRFLEFGTQISTKCVVPCHLAMPLPSGPSERGACLQTATDMDAGDHLDRRTVPKNLVLISLQHFHVCEWFILSTYCSNKSLHYMVHIESFPAPLLACILYTGTIVIMGSW